ncbi:cullin-5-like [Oscarella lobularis]|uniref:cullin-5-like n=1 Tax=Oscarella lobularis TaxID=121494 RepID=UPI0033137BD7
MLSQTGRTFEERWEKGQMRQTTAKILNQEDVTKREWQNLFWDVHGVTCWDERGWQKVLSALEEMIRAFVLATQRRVMMNEDDSTLLKAYIAEWTRFFTQTDYLPKPFRKSSTGEGKGSATTPGNDDGALVLKLMLDMWNEGIFANIKDRLQVSAMKIVLSERRGEAFDTQLVIGVRESYVNLCSAEDDKLKIYKENFEKAYLEATEEFYQARTAEYLAQNGVINYMTYALEKLKEEDQRALRYLETSKKSDSAQKLHECCVSILIGHYKDQILAECPHMIATNENDKLFLMYNLMNEVPDGIGPMMANVEAHIFQDGLADMQSCADTITTDPEKYVEKLLELFARYSKIVKDAFRDDSRFLTSRDKAYKAVVNDVSVFKLELGVKPKGAAAKTHPESKCPELLANYCDLLLRKTSTSKRLTSDEVEGKLKDVLLVLKYVQNKDVFMRYHKAHLSRRLVLGTSADSEKEENLVEWFREVGMPAEYVNKLARMFQDIKVSEDLNQEFQESLRRQGNSVADTVSIKILNAGAWSRSAERVPVSLPLELEDFVPEIEDFYRGMHSGRKLQWHHHMSNGVVTFCNKAGKFDLEITTYQMAILFSWNQRPDEKLSLEDLRLSTQLPDGELRRTLGSLIAFPRMKHQVLLCRPEVKSPREFDDKSVFFINQDFVVVRNGKVQKRAKVNLIGRLQLSTETSRKEDNEAIVALRVLRVQEAVVKIMKMRKRISNAALQTELVEMLKNMFLPQKKMIKEQIEWLIEHKYMKRDDNDINSFIYLA